MPSSGMAWRGAGPNREWRAYIGRMPEWSPCGKTFGELMDRMYHPEFARFNPQGPVKKQRCHDLCLASALRTCETWTPSPPVWNLRYCCDAWNLRVWFEKLSFYICLNCTTIS